MNDKLPLEVTDIVPIIVLLASTISVYINLLSKIQAAENIVKHLIYSIEVLKEKSVHNADSFERLTNESNRLSKQLELSIQQALSDKESSLLYQNNLKELIDHKAARWEQQITKLETEYKQSMVAINSDILSSNKAIEQKISELTNFLMKKSDFISRDINS